MLESRIHKQSGSFTKVWQQKQTEYTEHSTNIIRRWGHREHSVGDRDRECFVAVSYSVFCCLQHDREREIIGTILAPMLADKVAEQHNSVFLWVW